MPTHSPQTASVASHIPGRLRLKIGRGRQDAARLERIKTRLETRPGIGGVRVNPASGSLVVHYDPKQHSTAGILGALEDVNVLVESLGLGHADGGAPLTVGQAIADLNARLSRWSGLPIDLAVILPLAFVGAGAWSMARNGLMLEKVPGWFLLWLGFDVFVKTHPRDGVSADGDTASEP